MKLRRFTPDGLQTFRDYLALARREPDTVPPNGLLESRALTEVVVPEVRVADNHFETKGEAAQYLSGVLRPLPADVLLRDSGLWSWLSLLYFDSICQFRADIRVVKNDYYYVFDANNMRHFYRHLLFVSWRIMQLSPSHNRLFLRSRLDTMDQITERVMARLFLIRIPCVFELLDRLYWDESKGRPRPGITDAKIRAGNLRHRLPLRIRQLENTFDLMSLSADQLIDLLGDEFSFARLRTRRLAQGVHNAAAQTDRQIVVPGVESSSTHGRAGVLARQAGRDLPPGGGGVLTDDDILRIWTALPKQTFTEARVFSCVIAAHESNSGEFETGRAREVMHVVWPQNTALGAVPSEIRGHSSSQNQNRNRQADFTRLMRLVCGAS